MTRFPISAPDFLPSLRTVSRRSGRSAPRWRGRGLLRTDLPSRHPRTPCCCCSRCPPTLPASSWKTASYQLCAPGSSTCTQIETLGTSLMTSPLAHPSAPASAAPTPTPAPLCGWWWRATSDCTQCPVTAQRKLGSLQQLVPLRSVLLYTFINITTCSTTTSDYVLQSICLHCSLFLCWRSSNTKA